MKILGTSESAYVDAVKAEIFKHRITGARLLDMTQKDLEYIAISKIGIIGEFFLDLTMIFRS